jgi:hypothetical protein
MGRTEAGVEDQRMGRGNRGRRGEGGTREEGRKGGREQALVHRGESVSTTSNQLKYSKSREITSNQQTQLQIKKDNFKINENGFQTIHTTSNQKLQLQIKTNGFKSKMTKAPIRRLGIRNLARRDLAIFAQDAQQVCSDT